MAEKEELGLGLIEEVTQAVLKVLESEFSAMNKKIVDSRVSIARIQENVYYIKDEIQRIKDKKDKQIIEMFKEIKEEIMKPTNEYHSLNQLFTFLIHSLAGKPTIQDLNIVDPTIKQIKIWREGLQRLADLYEDGDAIKRSIVEIEQQMKEYIGDKKK